MEFLNIEIDKSTYIKILICFMVAVLIYIALTMSSLLIFKSYTLGPETSVEDEVLNTHIDILEAKGKKIEIAGWAYKEGEEIGKVNTNYVLKNQETGKMYLMRTKMKENESLDEMYRYAGIHAQCLLFGIPDGKYDIMVLYQDGEKEILTSTLISVELE